MPHAIPLLEGTLSSLLLLTISPEETALRAQPRTCCIARVRATTTAAVPRPLIPSNDGQAAAVAACISVVPLIRRGALALEEAGEGAAAVAVADEEMDKSNDLSVPSRRRMASDMSHIFCATGAGEG